KRTGMSFESDLWLEHPIKSPCSVPLAVKAAELQGKRAGKKYLRQIQEYLFLSKKNISDDDVLIECAKKTNLDIEEFKNDLHSTSAKNALQCYLRLLKEMEVDYVPTIVFFNQLTNDL